MVLAAGGSQRLGRPKQLLPYLGKTLVEHAARTALASGAEEVIIVVGSNADAIRAKLSQLPVKIVLNRNWESGLGSSIRCGVESVSSNSSSVVIALVDQPQITPGLLRDLACRQFETGAPIVASAYDGILGVPCAFGREVFGKLCALSGEAGARELIRKSGLIVEQVSFSGGNIDVDTPEDYQRLISDFELRDPQDPFIDFSHARSPPHS